MSRGGRLARGSLALLGVAFSGACDDDAPSGEPQAFVVCTGWHALCSASPDCRVSGPEATCDCLRVDEPHIVETDAIQDVDVQRRTRSACTLEQPCDVDQAPVCAAIRDGTYTVDGVAYDWVSTFSYRGWCSLIEPAPRPCDPRAPGYDGDRAWAVCDGAPCTELQEPADPERPLSCRCRVLDTPFVGLGGTCTGDDGGIMSSSPMEAWDFERGTYRIPLPGLEWVEGACAALASDP